MSSPVGCGFYSRTFTHRCFIFLTTSDKLEAEHNALSYNSNEVASHRGRQ